MQRSFDEFGEMRFMVGNAERVQRMQFVKAMRPFSDEALSFLNDLSRLLLKADREYSDVATFAFWCRRAALIREKEKYDDISDRLGRGVAFHVAPSNVPVNFAFSLAAGLLAGNANIVRIPSKDFPQVDIICKAMNHLLTENAEIAAYIALVRYTVSKEITDALSSISDTRVIWGGDSTIADIRRSPMKPRANEITFADRYSMLLIHADEYLNAQDKDRIARDFYNDTYFSDQNACTAPRIIFWMGERKEEAKAEFWKCEYAFVKGKYTLAPVQAVGKLGALYKVAARRTVRQEKTEDGLITRVFVPSVDSTLMEFKYGSGFFFECDIEQFADMLPACGERCQTLTYYGVRPEDLWSFVNEFRPRGLDRMVPVGNSMNFSLIWDGCDLIRTMSRKLEVSK